MAKVGNVTKFSGGIANSEKEGQPNAFFFARSIDFRSDARHFSLLPASVKESGTIVNDLPLWGERVGTSLYAYDRSGGLYLRSSSGLWTNPHNAPSSSGNGLSYFGEDDYLYYLQDTTIGRYGPVNGSSPQWYDGFLSAEGGAPTNTNALKLVAASSQFADRADTASLSITSDLTLEAFILPTTLPASGSTMTLVSKWDESGTTRSYIMDIKGISAAFGDGSDGAYTVAVNTTRTEIDSVCTGTSGSYTLSATNVSFAAGQKILIHQSQGTGAGTKQFTSIVSYTAGTITTDDALNADYTTGAQVMVMNQYTDVTVNSGVTLTAKAWTGTVGGILAFYANGTVTVTGTISANSKGFRASNNNSGAGSLTVTGEQGEGTSGANGTRSNSANGNGGGGGTCSGAVYLGSGSKAGGGGGGNGAAGTAGTNVYVETGGVGGSASGSADLTSLTFGGAGGGGGVFSGTNGAGAGGNGGGAIIIFGTTLTVTGSVTANGAAGAASGTQGGPGPAGGGGGGAGGSILLAGQVTTLGTALITATGGAGGAGSLYEVSGGAGSDGRIHLNYYTSYSGTTNPTLTVTQDNNLASTTGYQVRLGISSTGNNSEYLAKTVSLTTTIWTRLSVVWTATTATAIFYQDAVSLGSVTGTLTSIHDNASRFAVGKNTNGAGSAANFYNGLIDDVRVWSKAVSATSLLTNLNSVLTGSETNLAAYYKFDNNYNDATANSNNLTSSGSPTFVTTVPFSGVTTRNDQDQSATGTGNTYTLPTAISEAATERKAFVPAKDPQKSIRFYISAIGTGDWTVTIHDGLDRTMASATVTNANLNTGYFEFIYTSVWRPNIGATYHAHIVSTVADGTVRTQTNADLTTADYATFYQFLVDDDYHPAVQFTNFEAWGNERYLATWDGQTYNPHALTLPSGYRIRCLGFWREYLAIGTWRGTSISDYDTGKIFFWDGTAETYNFFIDVPEGGINALLGSKGILYIVAGYLGDLLLYQGGDAAEKLRRLPKMTTDKTLEIYPGALTMWQALLRLGVGVSTSTAVERGVYSWGSLDRSYPESLGYDFPLSTGNRTATNIKVGMVVASGSKLFIGWQDNISFGIDVVDPAGSPFATGTLESLISDFGQISKSKLPLLIRADFEALPSGGSVGLKYKVDRNSNWTTTQTVATAGATENRLIVKNRLKEFQIGVDLGATTSSPVITGISVEVDNLEGERDI